MAKKHGFSLVELAIVLVILGLLAGGVISGQSLIKAASLRATLTQISDISVATNSFREKYFGLPGDLNNAASFWTSTSSGNGNGVIETSSGCSAGKESDPDCDWFNGERARFFSQLGLAGLTNGYDTSSTLGKGFPAVKANPKTGMIITGSWAVSPSSSNNVGIETIALDPIYLYLGVCNPSKVSSGTSLYNDCGVFKPEEAWNIDSKIDDGKPLSGKFLSEAYTANCVTGAGTPSTATYSLNVTDVTCNSMVSMR